jgi:hypothetical protein
MRRDDFNVRIDEVRELATKYSKPELQRMVQMGVVEPQKAVMAGMMIDRIAKSVMQPPQTTVAQDVLGMSPTAAQGQIPPQMPQGQMPPQMPPQMAADGGIMGALPYSDGLAALPANIPDYAGGGIVAFAEGGAPEDYVRASRQADAALATMPQSDAQTLPGGYKLREYAPMKDPSLQEQFDISRKAEQMAGVDPDLYKRMRQEEAGRRDEIKGRREEAKGEALLMAGLGLMGARRGQEFEVLGNVGRQAVQQYSGALKEIRENERDIKKTERELMLAEDRMKRDTSGKAANQYQSLLLRKEDQENKQIDQFNKAQEKASDLFVTQYGIDENAKRALEVAKMSGDYQIKVAQIHAATAGKPGETERLLGRYHDILAKQGPEAANKFMGDVERVRGAGKPQNIMSYEEAMKIVNADVMNASKSIEEKKRMAIEMMQSDPMRSGMTGQSSTPNPFKLSPEAAAALKQYGGK